MTTARLPSALLPIVLGLACRPTGGEPQDETGSSSDGSEGSAVTTSLPPSPETSTSTADDTAATSTADDTAGSMFLEPPDGGVCVAPGEGHWHCLDCDLWQQYCTDGHKCTPWANDGGSTWNAMRCTPIAPDPAAPGEPCTMEGSPTSGLDDCAQGSMCWSADPETLEGVCVPHCQGSEASPSCAPGTHCVMSNDGAVVVCLPTCDPLGPDACPADETCTLMGEAPVCIPSTGVVVPPCGAAACAPGQTCLIDDVLEGCTEAVCCTPWCDLTAADPQAPCAAQPAHTCQPYYEPGRAPTGLEHLGVCRLPA